MSKQLENSKRYRILGWINELDGSYVTKGKTIYQCDSIEEALAHVKKIHQEHLECTYFTIERGEWL